MSEYAGRSFLEIPFTNFPRKGGNKQKTARERGKRKSGGSFYPHPPPPPPLQRRRGNCTDGERRA